MVITQIQQAKKNINRVNIFLDNNFWVGLDKDELLNFNLFNGKEITFQDKQEIEKSSSDTKLFTKAANYIQIRPRSIKEIRDYLYRKESDKETSEIIIQKLKDKNLLSDEEFAKWLIVNRIASGRYGEVKIKAELYKKGVKRDIIERTYLENVSDEDKEAIEENANKQALKFIKIIKAENKYELKSKLIQKLMARGYKFDLSKNVAENTIRSTQ